MGNAHIPTTNACVLCHGAGGEVKVVPAMLHPVEGWRRCVTCHSDENLGRKAPGHEGIAEEECLNCHKVAEAGPAITRPHSVLQDQGCLDCHGTFAHLPSSMASAKETDCVLCHKADRSPAARLPARGRAPARAARAATARPRWAACRSITPSGPTRRACSATTSSSRSRAPRWARCPRSGSGAQGADALQPPACSMRNVRTSVNGASRYCG